MREAEDFLNLCSLFLRERGCAAKDHLSLKDFFIVGTSQKKSAWCWGTVCWGYDLGESVIKGEVKA